MEQMFGVFSDSLSAEFELMTNNHECRGIDLTPKEPPCYLGTRSLSSVLSVFTCHPETRGTGANIVNVQCLHLRYNLTSCVF